ncbi:protein of unknown function (plasmid) [Azospirillum baldaniorum]|uniref:Uncharacterized protein n=1 Tax=Azospirillum baldaniorum TaxID=1064539 RepID=A0A9P1K141_9PROT|nr:protein of unknown function [Azospirillum baldaniorum]
MQSNILMCSLSCLSVVMISYKKKAHGPCGGTFLMALRHYL